MNQATTHSSSSQFETVLYSYLYEAERLGLIAESGRFAKLLPRFGDYHAYLTTIIKTRPMHKLVRHLNKGGVVLDITKGSPALEELLSCSHIAACCDLFAGSSFPVANLERDSLRLFVSNFFNNLRSDDNKLIVPYFDKLNSADAIRTIQTLKLLGLVTANTHTSRQLSFGVGNATKDLYSIHMLPHIQHNTGNVFSAHNHQDTVVFNVEKNTPSDVLLVDNHPDAEAYFDKLNKEWHGKVIGFNKDAYELLEELPSAINSNEILPRDLIVSLRFDHLMLPNVDRFMKYVGNVIDKKADLIMSIGAGHTDEEFEGRLKKMSELYDCLRERQLKPLRIKLYRGNNITEKRERPGLGAPQYATYEIIYCRLEREKLK